MKSSNQIVQKNMNTLYKYRLVHAYKEIKNNSWVS